MHAGTFGHALAAALLTASPRQSHTTPAAIHFPMAGLAPVRRLAMPGPGGCGSRMLRRLWLEQESALVGRMFEAVSIVARIVLVVLLGQLQADP